VACNAATELNRLPLLQEHFTAEPADNSQQETRPSPQSSPGESPAVQAQQALQQLRVNDSKAVALYANFCRVTGTSEELILDFGLNPQPLGVPSEPIPLTQRIIMNFYTAKRTLYALQMTIQRHEAAFGVLETDVQRRVQPAARQRG